MKPPQQYRWGTFALAISWLILVPLTVLAQSDNLIISRLGLSQVQGTTLLTMILSRPAQPSIQPLADPQTPQLIIDFPQARVFDVPLVQAGDEQLVKQVRTMAIPGGDGVRIVLELVPGRAYTFWRVSRVAPRGGYQFVLGIRPDAAAGPPAPPPSETARPTVPRTPAPATAPPPSPPYEPGPTASPRSAAPPEAVAQPRTPTYDYRRPTSGPMSEIANLMPDAGPVLEFLERQGWTAQKDNAGRKGSPGSQRFLLTNAAHPDLSVVAEHVPTKASNIPGVNVIALSTDRLADPDAQKYRQMVRWDLATIRKHFEDIGDYYDDGLKPLRIRLRERAKAAFLREFDFLQQFLLAAVPQKPELAAQIRKHLDERVNKRLEGAQYTESANPLVIFDLTDFYTIRVYFLGR
ncbi:MAG: hypothetical protein ACUVRZ_04490 [Desulfobacca sp.]|uniref:hypothetical protein n=1 Tax=Desulfobacca sp. TaxID=2067990 RepID=UPI00404B3C71